MLIKGNFKRYRIIIIILIVVNLVLIGALWQFNINNRYDNRWRGRGDDKGRFGKERFEDALRLDSLQKEEFDNRNRMHFHKIHQLNGEIDSIKVLVRDEIFKSNTDEEKLNKLFESIAQKRTTIDTSIYNHFKNLRSLCSPSQTAAYDSMMNGFFNRPEFSRRNDRRVKRER